MNSPIQGRLFLVGSPRSGSTLLQSMLAVNSRIASFPETHFFEGLFPRPWLAALGVASRRARSNWKVFLEAVGHPELYFTLPRGSLFVRQFSGAFVQVLDTITSNQGKAVWLEKTPGHLCFVDQIERLVGGARFVHILRNGLNNIASLYDVGQKYPEMWLQYRTLDQCIQRWAVDARLSKQCSSRDNHRLVKYEQLAADPKPILTELCEFIGVPFEDEMLTNHARVVADVVLPNEPWKVSVGEPIQARNTRFNELFDEERKQYVLTHFPDDLRGDAAVEEALRTS